MPTADTASRLRALLAERSNAIAERALNGEELAPAEVERLQLLAKLAELANAQRPPRRARAPAVALAATLAIASLLLFARVGETEVEIETTVDELSFTLAAPQALTETMVLSALAAAPLRELRWPRGVASGAAEPVQALRVATAPSAAGGGSVTLPSQVLPAATRVRLASRPGLRLSLQPAPQLTVNLMGSLVLHTGAAAPLALALNAPAGLQLSAAGAELELELEPAAAAPAAAPLALPLQVTRLAFERVDVAQQGPQSVVRRLSTIVAGELRLVALNNSTRKLRRGEMLRFEAASGTLQTLRHADGQLTVGFSGRVRGMSGGSADNPRPLMPTWLEWLRDRHGLSLLWGSGLYLAGLAMAAWRWWSPAR